MNYQKNIMKYGKKLKIASKNNLILNLYMMKNIYELKDNLIMEK